MVSDQYCYVSIVNTVAYIVSVPAKRSYSHLGLEPRCGHHHVIA